MMNEPQKSDVQKKLDDEERARRMREGGEDMRAQYEMEQAERSKGGEVERGSSLSPEEERRREMGRGQPHSGMGETQQAQMAMWGKSTERPYETRSMAPEPRRASTGEPFTSGPDITRRETAQERSSERTYPAGTGSLYRDPSREPMGPASTGEPFTSGPEVSGRGRPSEAGMRSELDYPAGTGSRYRDSNVQPTERASTGEYFTSGPEATGEAPRSPPSGYYAREEPGMPSAPVSKAKGMTQTVAEQTKAGTGMIVSTAAVKGKEVSHMVSGKAKEIEESRGAEEFANRAGEVIGRTVRKTMAVAKELTFGLKKGMTPKNKGAAPERVETTETRTAVRSKEEK